MAESPIVKRIPPKKLQPSNLLPLLPDGSTGVVVDEMIGLADVVTGFSVVLVVIVVGVVFLVVVVAVVESVTVVDEVVVVDETVVVVVLELDVLGVVRVVVSFSGVKLVSNFGGIAVAGLPSSEDWGHLSSDNTTSSNLNPGFKSPIASSVTFFATHFVSELLNEANLQSGIVKHPTQVSSISSQEFWLNIA